MPRRFAFFRAFLSVFVFLSFNSGQSFSDEAIVIRAVDGDTIEVSLQGKSEKIRMIGVDTPEIHESEKLYRDAERSRIDISTIKSLGEKAFTFTKKQLRPGDTVILQYDQTRRDRYDRILAYVFKDDTFVNGEIIRQGYGYAYTRYPFKYMEDFRRYEKEARENGRGLWGRNSHEELFDENGRRVIEQGIIIGNKKSKIYHLPGNINYGRVAEANRVVFKNEEEAINAGYRRSKK